MAGAHGYQGFLRHWFVERDKKGLGDSPPHSRVHGWEWEKGAVLEK